MLKVLVFNRAIRVDQQPGEQWTLGTVYVSGQALRAESDSQVVDHDVFIFDADAAALAIQASAHAEISQRIAERVAAGGCLICFVSSPSALQWIPSVPPMRAVKGSAVDVFQDPQFRPITKEIEADPSFVVEFGSAPRTPGLGFFLAIARDGFSVSTAAQHGNGWIFLFPPLSNARHRIVRALIDKIIPDRLPGLVHKDEVTDEPPPPWIADHLVPGTVEAQAEVERLDRQIYDLRLAKAEGEGQLEGLLALQGLLWLQGFALERVVQSALNRLGITVERGKEVDLFHVLDDGRRLYIEVEGTAGMTAVKKGSQLLRYIADDEDPASILGAIIANPLRMDPPASRPKDQLFSKQLASLAHKQGWPLITTVQLFGWVTRHLQGDAAAVLEARRALGIVV